MNFNIQFIAERMQCKCCKIKYLCLLDIKQGDTNFFYQFYGRKWGSKM